MKQWIHESFNTEDGILLKGNVNRVVASYVILEHVDSVVQLEAELFPFHMILEVSVHFVNATLDGCTFMSYVLMDLPDRIIEIKVFHHILHIVIHFRNKIRVNLFQERLDWLKISRKSLKDIGSMQLLSGNEEQEVSVHLFWIFGFPDEGVSRKAGNIH